MTYTAPRTWVSSEVVTAAMFNTNVRDNELALVDRVQIVRKTADESVTSSTTLQNDDHLFFTVVAGQTYAFEINLFLNSGTQLADLKVALTFPAGTMSFGGLGIDPASSTSPLGAATSQAIPSATSGTSTIPFAGGGDGTVMIRGTFVPTTGGTVQLQWAQNASSATAMTLKTGSYLVATRAAA